MTPILLLTLALVQTPADLSGLWTAAQRFGPDARGTLLIMRAGNTWRADIAGYAVESATLAFQLPDDQGRFAGKLVGREIHGHWVQPVTNYNGGRYATPVTLVPDGPNRWRGTVTPWDDRFTMYFLLTPTAPGKYNTFLRNPDRNLGRFFRVTRVEQHRDTVLFFGNQGQGEQVMTQGIYDDGGIWSVRLRGGAYDFSKVADTTNSGFYPRGRPAPRYRYAQPLALNDGWPVANPEDVGMSRDSLERFVQMLIDLPMDSLTSLQVHSVLVARHGRLVLEEYFHGYSRDLPHEMRSASKSTVSLVFGAATTAGIPIDVNTPVYQTMGATPDDPRKRALTLDHLLNMSAGFECNPDSAPGRTADEDVMAQNRVQDLYGHTMAVPLNAAPGEKVFYCSMEPNLAGGVIAKLAGESMTELFDRLIARPLEMGRYHLGLQPNGDAYGGGGHLFTSRDFLKWGQLMLNGRWGSKQILSADWIRRSRAPLVDLSPAQQYRWFWNSREYDWGGKKVRAYFAGGNGGQVSVAFPDLDLVIVLTGGNYNGPATPAWRRVYGLQDILAAVR